MYYTNLKVMGFIRIATLLFLVSIYKYPWSFRLDNEQSDRFQISYIISISVSPNVIHTLELIQQHFSHDDFPPLMRVDYPRESNVRVLPWPKLTLQVGRHITYITYVVSCESVLIREKREEGQAQLQLVRALRLLLSLHEKYLLLFSWIPAISEC